MSSTWFFLKEISVHNFLPNRSSFDDIMLGDIFILIWSFIVVLNLRIFSLYCMRFEVVNLDLKQWLDYFMVLVVDKIFWQWFISFWVRTWNFVGKFWALFLISAYLTFKKHRWDCRNRVWIVRSLISAFEIFIQTLKCLLLFLLVEACKNHFVLL